MRGFFIPVLTHALAKLSASIFILTGTLLIFSDISIGKSLHYPIAELDRLFILRRSHLKVWDFVFFTHKRAYQIELGKVQEKSKTVAEV